MTAPNRLSYLPAFAAPPAKASLHNYCNMIKAGIGFGLQVRNSAILDNLSFNTRRAGF